MPHHSVLIAFELRISRIHCLPRWKNLIRSHFIVKRLSPKPCTSLYCTRISAKLTTDTSLILLAMEVLVKRLASADAARCLSTSLARSISDKCIRDAPIFRSRFPFWMGSLCSFSDSSSQSSACFVTTENDDTVSCHGFRTWHNGGGTFHHSACIDPTALIETGAVVHSKSVVGASVHIGSGSVIGHDVTIGQSTKIGYNVALSNCTVGDFCVIHNGVCIGQDGFGFFVDEHGTMKKKPQMLNVKIGTNVEIGSNTCIDRGSWRDTVIGNHTKIDNLVQIGHNVIIGDCCMLCGQVGIAGSVTIGDYVTCGGRVAIRDHVSVVSKVRLAAMSCVTKDIKEPGDYGGFPAIPISTWRRQVAKHSQASRKK